MVEKETLDSKAAQTVYNTINWNKPSEITKQNVVEFKNTFKSKRNKLSKDDIEAFKGGLKDLVKKDDLNKEVKEEINNFLSSQKSEAYTDHSSPSNLKRSYNELGKNMVAHAAVIGNKFITKMGEEGGKEAEDFKGLLADTLDNNKAFLNKSKNIDERMFIDAAAWAWFMKKKKDGKPDLENPWEVEDSKDEAYLESKKRANAVRKEYSTEFDNAWKRLKNSYYDGMEEAKKELADGRELVDPLTGEKVSKGVFEQGAEAALNAIDKWPWDMATVGPKLAVKLIKGVIAGKKALDKYYFGPKKRAKKYQIELERDTTPPKDGSDVEAKGSDGSLTGNPSDIDISVETLRKEIDEEYLKTLNDETEEKDEEPKEKETENEEKDESAIVDNDELLNEDDKYNKQLLTKWNKLVSSDPQKAYDILNAKEEDLTDKEDKKLKKGQQLFLAHDSGDKKRDQLKRTLEKNGAKPKKKEEEQGDYGDSAEERDDDVSSEEAHEHEIEKMDFGENKELQKAVSIVVSRKVNGINDMLMDVLKEAKNIIELKGTPIYDKLNTKNQQDVDTLANKPESDNIEDRETGGGSSIGDAFIPKLHNFLMKEAEKSDEPKNTGSLYKYSTTTKGEYLNYFEGKVDGFDTFSNIGKLQAAYQWTVKHYSTLAENLKKVNDNIEPNEVQLNIDTGNVQINKQFLSFAYSNIRKGPKNPDVLVLGVLNELTKVDLGKITESKTLGSIIDHIGGIKKLPDLNLSKPNSSFTLFFSDNAKEQFSKNPKLAVWINKEDKQEETEKEPQKEENPAENPQEEKKPEEKQQEEPKKEEPKQEQPEQKEKKPEQPKPNENYFGQVPGLHDFLTEFRNDK